MTLPPQKQQQQQKKQVYKLSSKKIKSQFNRNSHSFINQEIKTDDKFAVYIVMLERSDPPVVEVR